jgi:hypothetical protein
MQELLGALLRGVPLSSQLPFDRAAVTASTADRVAGAFVAGYQAALRQLVPELPIDRVVCLCATEEGGAHPRAIRTELRGERISGRKQWVTGGPQADELLVVVSVGVDEAGRNRLRVVRIDAHAPGVSLEPMAPTSFVPEIPHSAVRFEDAPISAVLPGDGYDEYLKPFRTIEDAHVFGAVLAWVLGVARRSGWPREACERIVAALVVLREVAQAAPSAPETHIALAGALELGRTVIDVDQWSRVDEETRALWQRDSALLSVAGKARSQRAQSAWTKISSA